MTSYKKIVNLAGWVVFAIAFVVYFMSAERSGSLWDCGEFILGAYKLQVVHPPGAPLFLIVGRIFAWIGDVFSSNPENIAFAVNVLSGTCTAFAATMIAWSTGILGKIALVGKKGKTTEEQNIALGLTSLIAGLTTAFCTSVWFSAVEGEVYAMSTFFTCLTLWSMIKWYSLPDKPEADKWLILTLYSAGLSIGVHLLSLLTFPALALFYYFKKYKKHTFWGGIIAMGVGAALIGFIQKVIIVGIPTLWSWMELMMVNGFGLPFHTGLIPTILILVAFFYFGLKYAHRKQSAVLQNVFVGLLLLVISMTSFGAVVLRANASPPINMNEPGDAFRLLSYLNREQYGERPLLKGPHFNAKPIRYEQKDRYGRVGDRYEIVEKKFSRVYNSRDEMFFPRMSHDDQSRPQLYRMWMGKEGNPTFADNITFFFKYQVVWMYWRYFMWNFSGRQNGNQGYEPWNLQNGHWYTGITPFDEVRLYNHSELPATIKNDKSRNRYFLFPFILGLIGLFYHARKSDKEFLTLMALFLITGLGIIVYSNQPPREPRERDYVLVGSFITYSMWIGFAVLAVFEMLKNRLKQSGKVSAIAAGAVILVVPLLMGFQNFDDHTRKNLKGARDYASNFLNSVEEDAILFTYGDNDTYPLWYAQEVEGIRRDVRVINLSLIAVDWYINQMRRKVNDSAPVKFTMPAEAYRGDKRNQMFFNPKASPEAPPMDLRDALKYAGEYHPMRTTSGQIPSLIPAKKLFLPMDPNQAMRTGWIPSEDSTKAVNRIQFDFSSREYLTKDDIAVLDIIASNIYDRPIYFAMTAQLAKLMGLQNYMQVEGIAARIAPSRTQSIPSLSIYGVGEINVDKVYDAIMNKFRWGNFDKIEMHVDNSFAPTMGVTRFVFIRTMLELRQRGDTKRAADIAEKFFEGFPFMNFPYKPWEYYNPTQTNFTLEMIKALNQDNRKDRAKIHMKLLALETADYLDFYNSLSSDDLQSFSQEKNLSTFTVNQIIQEAQNMNDPEFTQEIQALLGSYEATPVPN